MKPGEDGRPNSTSRCDGPLRRAVRRGGAKISTVLLAGYDTNLCMIDKPCGSRSLSGELLGDNIEVVLVRDSTRPGPTAFENTFATWTSFVELIEQAPWLHALPVGKRFIRSALAADIMRGFGLDAPLPPPSEGLPQVSVSLVIDFVCVVGTRAAVTAPCAVRIRVNRGRRCAPTLLN